MNRTVRVIVAVAAVQAALGGAYWWVEGRRSVAEHTRAELGTAPPLPENTPMPPLRLRAHDGTQHQLGDLNRPALVHFWATWCPPCRTELPGLLAVPDKHPLHVVAIALDRDWHEVERFLNGSPPANIYLADSTEVEAAFGIRSLPVTYLVDPGGHLRLRFDGARDWGDSDFLRRWGKGITPD